MTDDILKSVWPEWQVVKRIGRGAYGEVYQVVRKDSFLEDTAAVKVIKIPNDSEDLPTLRTEGFTDEQARSFLRGVVDSIRSEIKLMIMLKGAPNIVTIDDYAIVEHEDELHWDIFIRMELLETLDDYAKSRPGGRFSQEDVVKLGRDICTALEYCAKPGVNIIHRDIKPANILYNRRLDAFKLGDFGVARQLDYLSTSYSYKGTPNYMAPEVKNGVAYDQSVDTYSLGLVLYKFTNHSLLPFLNPESHSPTHGEREAALQRRFSGEPLPRPGEASDALAEVILRACAFRPGERFASAEEMREALEQIKNNAKPAPPPRPEPKPEPAPEPKPEPEPEPYDEPEEEPEDEPRDWKKIILLAAAVVLALAAIAFGLTRLFRNSDAPSASAPTPAPVETPTEAPAATPTPEPTAEPGGDWAYEPYGTGCAVTGCRRDDAAVVIPEAIEGKAVVRIGDSAFSRHDAMTSLELPDGVTDIGRSAFYLCNNLETVVLPASLTAIENNAFQRCEKLSDVYYAGSRSDWQKIAVGGGNESLAGATIHYGIDEPEPTAPIQSNPDYDYAFEGDDIVILKYRGSRDVVVIPGSISGHRVVGIGPGAFQDCGALTEIVIPVGVTEIGDGAFSRCASLAALSIPEGLAVIGDAAFEACAALTTVWLPNSLTRVGERAFGDCPRLTDVYYDGYLSGWQGIVESGDPIAGAALHCAFRLGDEGDAVWQLQFALQQRGYLPANERLDGEYTQRTANAVNDAKRNYGMTPNGVADLAFQERLLSEEPGDNSYIFPDSDRVKLTEAQILAVDRSLWPYARNEIFARHGYSFTTERYRTYFESKSWYHEGGFSTNDLNEIEWYNMDLLKKMENAY